jgi:uncharacterized protein YdhG (YjbR/CyaY superfamily)
LYFAARNWLSKEAQPDNILPMKTKQLGATGSVRNQKLPIENVDQYIAATPEPARAMLIKMRAAIGSSLPAEATEVLSYMMPAFKLKKTVVWFAAFRDHCSLFPTPAVIDQFKAELAAYKTSKGTVQFSFDKPLPLALIKKIVKARLELMAYQRPQKAR